MFFSVCVCVGVCSGAEFCARPQCEEEEGQAEGRGPSSVAAQRRDAALQGEERETAERKKKGKHKPFTLSFPVHVNLKRRVSDSAEFLLKKLSGWRNLLIPQSLAVFHKHCVKPPETSGFSSDWEVIFVDLT